MWVGWCTNANDCCYALNTIIMSVNFIVSSLVRLFLSCLVSAKFGVWFLLSCLVMWFVSSSFHCIIVKPIFISNNNKSFLRLLTHCSFDLWLVGLFVGWFVGWWIVCLMFELSIWLSGNLILFLGDKDWFGIMMNLFQLSNGSVDVSLASLGCIKHLFSKL